MVEISNECVGCPPEMGCLGLACPNRNVKRYYCDECGDDVSDSVLYDYEGKELCLEYILNQLKETDNLCEECGTEISYLFDGRFLCECCIEKELKNYQIDMTFDK